MTKLFIHLNLGAGLDIKAQEENTTWINMDSINLPGINCFHDMMKTPWPFKDEEFDFVLASHVLEHVPHHHESNRDGFLVVMEQIHRVLKPNGILSVIVPHHENLESCFGDPTHTRVIVPRTWGHFKERSGVPSWYTRARFTLMYQEPAKHSSPLPNLLRIGPSNLGILDHLTTRMPSLRRKFGKPTEMHYCLRRDYW